MACTPTFTAVVRWRGPDPTIEIETRHPGFSTPEDAALFANAFAPDAPLGIRLPRNNWLLLLMPDGNYVRSLGTDITVWAFPSGASNGDDLAVANDNDFEPHPFANFGFPSSAFGDYDQAQYAVLDQEGAPVDVVVDFDEHDHLRVTVERDATPEDVRAFLQLVSI